MKSKIETIFTEVYQKQLWGSIETVSGPGSTLNQTEGIRDKLSKIFRALNITTLLDLPCGDFNWMNHVDLSEIDYIGADIVADLIKNLTQKYQADRIHFQQLDIVTGRLPKVDLILCRDCLVHLRLNDIKLAIRNICESEITYLLTTTFTNKQNRDIQEPGQWRPLNFQEPPFTFPQPLQLLIEDLKISEYADKSLGLWKIEDIRNNYEN